MEDSIPLKRISAVFIATGLLFVGPTIVSAQRKATGETTLVGIRLFDTAYRLLDVYGNPDEIQGVGGGGGGIVDGQEEPKKKKRKIKLIFICGDNKGMIEKEVNKDISTQLLSDIRNKIEEVTKTQIVLKDVQIIKG